MISLLGFMGGGSDRNTSGTFNTAWGDGRVLYFVPTAAVTLNLPTPTDDHLGFGWPGIILINVSGGFIISVQTDTPTAVDSFEVGLIYLGLDSAGARKWYCDVYDRLT